MGYDKGALIRASLAQNKANAGEENALDDDLSQQYWAKVNNSDFDNMLNAGRLLATSDATVKGLIAQQNERKKAKASLDPLKRKLEEMKAPTPLAMEAQATRGTGALPQFERQRQLLSGQANEAASAGSKAINRRFAAMGALNSGSAIKQQQLAQQKIDEQKNDAANAINTNEAMTHEQNFQQAQAGVLQRNFARETGNQQMGFQAQLQGFDAASKLAGLDLAWAQHFGQRDDSAKSLELYQKQNEGGGFMDLIGNIVGGFTGGLVGSGGKTLGEKIFK